jgi:uncharacterized protein
MAPPMTAGIGLKPVYFDAALDSAAEGMWLEVHPENYFVDGGARLAWLEAMREKHPVSLHGVALSLAADCPPDTNHLKRLTALARRIAPALVSEHLAWSAWRGVYYPDLLPFPRTGEALRRIVDNIGRTQDALGRRIAVENPSHYVHLGGHAWDEIDFLREIVRRTGCGLLLDINNVYVGACNLGYSAIDYIDRFPAEAVMEIHLAGHSADSRLGNSLLIDSHDAPVAAEVWSLYERFVARAGMRPTLIERDDSLPSFDELMAERSRADVILRESMKEAA